MTAYLIGTPTFQSGEPTIRVVSADGVLNARKGETVRVRLISTTLDWYIGNDKHTTQLPGRTNALIVDRTHGDQVALQCFLQIDQQVQHTVDLSPASFPD